MRKYQRLNNGYQGSFLDSTHGTSSWISDVGIAPTNNNASNSNNVPLFLENLDPNSRREMLAFHAQYCLSAKYRHMQSLSDLVVKDEPSLECSIKIHPDSTTKETSDEDNRPKLIDLMNSSSKASISTIADPMSNGNYGVYEKFFVHLQHFYNEHDAMAIAYLLMIPCCVHEVVREVVVWMPSSKSNPSVTLEDIGTPTKRGDLSVVWRRSVSGEDCYRGGFEDLFNKLPDCIIVFHSLQIHHFSEGTVVCAPYSYFFTIAVPVDNTNNEVVMETTLSNDDNNSQHSHSSSIFTARPSTKRKLVNVELVGCYVNYYNRDNLIKKQTLHSAVKFCSDPNLTAADIIKVVYA